MSTTTDIVLCSQCRFWEQITEAPPMGECRRHSPKPGFGKLEIGVTFFPKTKGDLWCGEGAIRLTE